MSSWGEHCWNTVDCSSYWEQLSTHCSAVNFFSPVIARQLSKLRAIGVQGELHAWLVNFLSEHFQYVSHQTVSASSTSVLSGVMLGSVLGPLLFNIFINDLPSVIKSLSVWIFADDVKFVGGARLTHSATTCNII